jgi:hypothetical protein
MRHMEMTKHLTRRTVAIGVAVAAVAVGAGAAVAKTSGAFDPKAERDAFEASVAKRLGVTPAKLQEAVKAATLERIDAAEAAGRLSKEQADELRRHVESGDLAGPGLGFGLGPGPFGHHGFFPGLDGPPGGRLDAAAGYLGLSTDELATKLENGQSLADVAKAQGKSVDGLKQAMLADVKTRLDQAVEDGKLTDAQRDEILADIEARLDDLVDAKGFEHEHRFRFGLRPGWGPHI